MVRIVWVEESVHLPLHMAHLKGLVFIFNGKNQRQWDAT